MNPCKFKAALDGPSVKHGNFVKYSLGGKRLISASPVFAFLSTLIVYRGTGPKPVIPFLQETA